MTLLCSKSIHLVILAFKVLHGLAALQLSGFISHVSSLISHLAVPLDTILPQDLCTCCSLCLSYRVAVNATI